MTLVHWLRTQVAPPGFSFSLKRLSISEGLRAAFSCAAVVALAKGFMSRPWSGQRSERSGSAWSIRVVIRWIACAPWACLRKNFQEDTLNKLKEYLEAVRLSGDPESAFLKVVKPPMAGCRCIAKCRTWRAFPTSVCACPRAAARRLWEPIQFALRRKATSKRTTRLCCGWCHQIPSARRRHRRSRTTRIPTALRWMKPLMAVCACLKYPR